MFANRFYAVVSGSMLHIFSYPTRLGTGILFFSRKSGVFPDSVRAGDDDGSPVKRNPIPLSYGRGLEIRNTL